MISNKYFLCYFHLYLQKTPLQYAATTDDIKAIKVLLTSDHLDVNIRSVFYKYFLFNFQIFIYLNEIYIKKIKSDFKYNI